jgi:hypothetical protein
MHATRWQCKSRRANVLHCAEYARQLLIAAGKIIYPSSRHTFTCMCGSKCQAGTAVVTCVAAVFRKAKVTFHECRVKLYMFNVVQGCATVTTGQRPGALPGDGLTAVPLARASR